MMHVLYDLTLPKPANVCVLKKRRSAGLQDGWVGKMKPRALEKYFQTVFKHAMTAREE